MRVTATQARNRFGSLCAHAKREPVFVEKAGQLDTVILSAEANLALTEKRSQAGREARKQAFEAQFSDWIASENGRVDAFGIPSAELLPW